MGNAIAFGLDDSTRYLWTLPMFHCNGWTYTWAVTAVCGTHVCLRRVDPALIFPAIADHRVTHMCGAPIVLTMLIHAPDAVKRRFDHTVAIGTGGAAPPSAVIAGMERMGFKVTHLYGLTETYGPSTICAWPPEWDALDLDAKARKMARQGVWYPTIEGMRVVDTETGRDVPDDGETIGELWLRGNTVMKGYLKNPKATAEALAEGWFHTGDLAVMHGDGYIEVKDRSKDIIISGGENISSLEVEDVLFRHPKIMEAAVVARPDEKWGETPCAFVTVKPGAELTAEEVIAYCRENLAHFKAPRTVVFCELPKTSTGKIQKFVLRERAGAL
jgi:fatty-acyl-CoA synthase